VVHPVIQETLELKRIMASLVRKPAPKTQTDRAARR
jgi:hypothetical protein